MGENSKRVAPKRSGKVPDSRALPAKALPSKAQATALPPPNTASPADRIWGWVNALVAIAVLAGAASLTVGGAWIALKLIVDPDAIVWFNQFLPEWTQIPVASRETIQTLEEIQASLRRVGLSAGEPIALELANKSAKSKGTGEVLIPVLGKRPNCIAANSATAEPSEFRCQQIVELRIYQPARLSYQPTKGSQYFWLASQVAVEGLEESFVISPLVSAKSSHQGSTHPLPLTAIERLEGKAPNSGIWLNLSGQWRQGDTTIRYGRLAHYNPNRTYLGWMLPWTSPTDELPTWQEVTGGGHAEFIVNQTIGLEPLFKVYRLQPREFLPNPIQLEEISLADSALNTRTYGRILTLARSGLWSASWAWLNSLKQQTAKAEWPDRAQAQMDLIRLHAQVTKAQADKTWASPSQEVLTNLIDGRWARALQVYEASPENRREIITLLKGDSERLWNRVLAALKIDPVQPEIKAWGALIVTAKQGRPKAIAWLTKQQKNTTASNARINQLLDQYELALAPPESSTHTSQIVGTAKPVSAMKPNDWLRPQTEETLKLEPEQTWYEIQVAGFYDGDRWRRAGFSDIKLNRLTPGQQLWNLLGLATDNQIQIVVWTSADQQETLFASVKGAQLQGGTLRLLAAGPALATTSANVKANSTTQTPQPLALTASAMQWIQPQTAAIADFQQQQPQAAAKILPTLWRELQKTGQLPVSADIETEDLSQTEAGNWPIQQIDLTGNQQPEIVFVLDGSILASSSNSPDSNGQPVTSRTLIVSDSGNLLYSEFGSSSSMLTAIADLGDGGTPVLVINEAQGYRLKRWSPQQQRFE